MFICTKRYVEKVKFALIVPFLWMCYNRNAWSEFYYILRQRPRGFKEELIRIHLPKVNVKVSSQNIVLAVSQER